jgi:hypothetical protein
MKSYPSSFGIWLKAFSITITLFMLFGSTRTGYAQEEVTARVKFFVHPDFTQSMTLEELGQRLAGYVADMNTIYAKNTVRRFAFDPDSDVIVWTQQYPKGPCSTVSLPYEYWVMIDPSTTGISNSGSVGCNFYKPNALVSTGYKWRRIYSREEIATNALGGGNKRDADDYYFQLVAVLHEIGHQHGLGSGEYYTLSLVEDRTGTEPNLSTFASNNPTGPYWGTRSLILTDPMLRGAPAAIFMQVVQFSPLSATIINRTATGAYDATCPERNYTFCIPPQLRNDYRYLNPIVVEVLDSQTGLPVSGCSVFAYYVNARTFENQQIASGTTSAQGLFNFNWGPNPFNGETGLRSSNNMFRLVKAHCSGYAPAGDGISIFDLQAGREVAGGGAPNDFHYYNGKLTLRAVSPPITLSASSCPSLRGEWIASQNECRIATEVHILANGHLSIPPGSSLRVTANGSLKIEPGATLTNNGKLNIEGALTNRGTIKLDNSSAFLLVTPTGLLTNEVDGRIENRAAIAIHGSLTNHGNFSDYGNLKNVNSFTNSSTGTLTTQAGAETENLGTLTNLGSLIISGAHATLSNYSTLDNGGLVDTCGGTLNNNSPGTINNSGTLLAKTTIPGISGTGSVLSCNQPPVVAPIVIESPVIEVNVPFNVHANFTDPDVNDPHTGGWDWGDSTASPASFTESGGAGAAAGSHSYAEGGTYTIRLTVIDDDGSQAAVVTSVTVQVPTPTGNEIQQSLTVVGEQTAATFTLGFTTVTEAGATTVTPLASIPELPTGFDITDISLAYDINTTASFDGNVTLCVNYSQSSAALSDETRLKFLHYDEVNNKWEDITTSLDTTNDIICGTTTSFSPFVLAESTESQPPITDSTSPVITPNIVGTLGNDGWYIGDVTLTWSVVDEQSAISSSSGCTDVTIISADTAGVTFTCSATSAGGITSTPITIKRDATKPVVTVSLNGLALYIRNGQSTVPSCTATDNLSGFQEAVNATAVVREPSLFLPLVNGMEANSDAQSAPTDAVVAAVVTGPYCTLSGFDTSTIGTRTVTASATDLAGNVGSTSASYSVVAFSGFMQPVDNLPVINQAKAGSVIPVKFSLGGDWGSSILAAGYPKTQLIACTTSAPTDAIEETVTAGGSSLTYDATTNQYTYVWKTEKSWSGCRQFILKLIDGSEYKADFKFTK